MILADKDMISHTFKHDSHVQGRKGQSAAAGKPGTGNKKAGMTKPDWGAAATWFHTQGPDMGSAASTPQTRSLLLDIKLATLAKPD